MAFGGGKVILLGEHSVVHGRPALAAGLSRGVHASAEAAERDELVLPDWELRVSADPKGSESLERALDAILRCYDDTRPRLRIRADVALPAGAGLGCSAALGVAVVGAIDEALGIERAASERGELALAWETIFHGNPSGVDNAMAASGGVALFRRGEPLEPVPIERPLTLVVANSGESASTKEMVDSVARYQRRCPEAAEKVFDAIAALVRNARLALMAGDLLAFGQLMDLNQGLLSSLLLSTERLENLCTLAREAGAHGAKLTGSGGGGCIIAITEPGEVAERVRDALEAESEEAFVTTIEKREASQ